jgi:hypothetical protein
MESANLTAVASFAKHISELVEAIPSEHCFFSDSDVETVYECERIMALPGYRQLPYDQQAEVERQREQIMQMWESGADIHCQDHSEPHDDRFLRHKLNVVKRLWNQHQGMPLPAMSGN